MGQVTHEQVNLMLRLYDTRREPRLREAREWFLSNFIPQSGEELMRIAPPMSQENAFMRMVVSYWDMVASIVNRGLIDEDFFFENSGEQWLVWERLKPIAEFWRATFKNPHMFKNLEEHSNRFEAWRERRAPGTNEAVRSVMKQMREAAMATKRRTAGN
jgi:hypothetical protein